MTIAIAAEFPWGYWREARLPGASFASSGVILAADTRWSWDNGRDPHNAGRKIWTFGERAAVVLSGDVWAGEDAVQRLRQIGRRGPFNSPSHLINAAEGAFQGAYTRHIRLAARHQRPPCHRLWFLMGIVDAKGKSLVVRFASDASFRPIVLQGVNAIGVTDAVRRAKEYLEGDALNGTDLGKRLTATYEEWAIATSGCIAEAIRSGEQKIGGHVQMIIGDADGWKEMMVGESQDGDSWVDQTAPLDTLNSAKNLGFPPLAASEGDLVTDQLI